MPRWISSATSIFAIPVLVTLLLLLLALLDPLGLFSTATLATLSPILIALISLWGLIPTYLLNRNRDRRLKEFEIQKNVELNKQKIKEESYRKLIPYIGLLRHYKHILLFKEFDKHLNAIFLKYYAEPVTTIQDIERNDAFIREIRMYCQAKLREASWDAYLFASSEVIIGLKRFNRTASASTGNLQNHFEFEALINAMRRDLGYEEITGELREHTLRIAAAEGLRKIKT